MITIIKNIDIEGPGYIADILREDRREFHVYEAGLSPASWADSGKSRAIIVLGGPMNVDDHLRYPFLAQEVALLRNAIGDRIPVLGICLGAQLLARAAGARVAKARFPEFGIKKVAFTQQAANDPVFKNMPPLSDVFQWHEDACDIPPGAVVLAENSCCLQAFRVGASAYGIQFHIEVSSSMVRDWMVTYQGPDALSSPENEAILQILDKHTSDMKTRTAGIVRSFVNMLT